MDNYNKELDPTKACMNEMKGEEMAASYDKEVDPTKASHLVPASDPSCASVMNENGIISPTKVGNPYDSGVPNYAPIPVAQESTDGQKYEEPAILCPYDGSKPSYTPPISATEKAGVMAKVEIEIEEDEEDPTEKE